MPARLKMLLSRLNESNYTVLTMAHQKAAAKEAPRRGPIHLKRAYNAKASLKLGQTNITDLSSKCSVKKVLTTSDQVMTRLQP
eukprot:6175979-Pleurochrysis_carterae.AAC.1